MTTPPPGPKVTFTLDLTKTPPLVTMRSYTAQMALDASRTREVALPGARSLFRVHWQGQDYACAVNTPQGGLTLIGPSQPSHAPEEKSQAVIDTGLSDITALAHHAELGILALAGQHGTTHCVQFLATDTSLAPSRPSIGGVPVYRPPTLDERLLPHTPVFLQFSPDGTRLAAADPTGGCILFLDLRPAQSTTPPLLINATPDAGYDGPRWLSVTQTPAHEPPPRYTLSALCPNPTYNRAQVFTTQITDPPPSHPTAHKTTDPDTGQPELLDAPLNTFLAPKATHYCVELPSTTVS